MHNKKRVWIYRHQLFRPSEGFIKNQTLYLERFNPYFVGRHSEATSTAPNQVLTLPENSLLWRIRHTLLRDNSYFLDLASKEPPDLIHAHFGIEGVYALPLAQKLNKPLITTFHGFDATTTTTNLLKSGKPSWIQYVMHRKKLATQANKIICVSDFIKNQLLEQNFPEDKLLTHYIGIDTDQFQPEAKPDRQTILHVARLVEKKGTSSLLKAFKLVHQKHPECILRIIGDGPLRQTLIAEVQNLQLEKSVEFLGIQSTTIVKRAMQQASIFCLPSIRSQTGDSEGLGMVFLEAAATKTPCVATRHGGIPEAVIDGKTGYLVDENSPGQLAERLSYLLEHNHIRLQMGETARQFVTESFNLKKQTQLLEKIYNNVICNHIN